MKKLLRCVLALTAIAAVPASVHADTKVTCVTAQACGYPCYAISMIEYTDEDGNTYYEFGNCCWCI